ncbi:hypothetical protein HPB50_002848 [Hyalomma asiaticum]|uniref:Uncharacterized protein n=1 Tax=Hyalomma asiaticum TaxID=266040 RepID=A0ACB7SBI4_HYAAI|nr:hypothetical protein HPB50_002848 [Hyalomma asiaticum]
MGNGAQSKEATFKSTGMTLSECRLVQDTWRTFCTNKKQSGVLIFGAFLTQNPHLLPLFRRFRAMPLKMLTSDPAFRAHACSVGYQITAMVNSADDPVLLEALIRKNALSHTTRQGVYPQHFEILGKVILEVLQSKDEKRKLTPAAVAAWKKLLEFMMTVISNVYQNEGIKAEGSRKRASFHSETFSEETASAYDTCTSSEHNLTTGNVAKVASGSAQSEFSDGNWFARSKTITKEFRSAIQAKGTAIKPEQPNARDQQLPVYPQTARPTTEEMPVTSTSSYGAAKASLSSRTAAVEVASDNPCCSSVKKVGASAPSAVTLTAGTISAEAEPVVDSAKSCKITIEANSMPEDLVVSASKAIAQKGLPVTAATSAPTPASDTVMLRADSVNPGARPPTDYEAQGRGTAERVDGDAKQKRRVRKNEPSGRNVDRNATAEIPSTESGQQLSLGVNSRSSHDKVCGDEAKASVNAANTKHAASDLEPKTLMRNNNAQPPY